MSRPRASRVATRVVAGTAAAPVDLGALLARPVLTSTHAPWRLLLVALGFSGCIPEVPLGVEEPDASDNDAGSDPLIKIEATPASSGVDGLCDFDGGGDAGCVRDCAGTCDGRASTDRCGVCDDDQSNDCLQDCADVWGGSAIRDRCGNCDDDPTNDCLQDCAGTWGGRALSDHCGVCNGDPQDDCVADCVGTWGGKASTDMCGVCDDDPSNDCAQDCAGVWGGRMGINACGSCVAAPTAPCVYVWD